VPEDEPKPENSTKHDCFSTDCETECEEDCEEVERKEIEEATQGGFITTVDVCKDQGHQPITRNGKLYCFRCGRKLKRKPRKKKGGK